MTKQATELRYAVRFRLGFSDALFEAISGVTTTGLSTKATLVGAPQTFLFARAWMQMNGLEDESD